ncbi:hypothetical protein ES703_58064 [subsurface metagenome]
MKIANPGMTATELLNILNARRFNFYDEFNRQADDPEVWTNAGDGSFSSFAQVDSPTIWNLTSGNIIDNDHYVEGSTSVYGKRFTPFEEGYSTVTFEARVALVSIVDLSALLGLFETLLTDYAEPASRSMEFFVDPAITNTFRVRTYAGAEEETDTLVALDTDYHIFKMVWTTTSVLLYIDDVLVATHETQVPDQPMFIEFLIRTEAAANKTVALDYVHVELS